MDEPTLNDLIKLDQGAWRSAFKILYPIAYRTAKSPRINLNDADAEEVAAQVLREIVDCAVKVSSLDGLKALLNNNKCIILIEIGDEKFEEVNKYLSEKNFKIIFKSKYRLDYVYSNL